jgi:hypothetical protein
MQQAMIAAASRPMASVGGPLSTRGVQNSVPLIAPVRWPICTGTAQSKISVFSLASRTFSGGCLAIQCMRWSCHSKRPVLESCFHCGAPLPSASSARPPGRSGRR